VALEFMDILDDLLPHIDKMGCYFRAKLEELQKQFSFIREVRGQGLMAGMELSFPGQRLVLDAIEQGLLLNCTHDTVLRFLPPYIIQKAHVDLVVRALDAALTSTQPKKNLTHNAKPSSPKSRRSQSR
jgi:acetylornithine/N-succinyldiaminopimelate aminotransferase